MLSRDSSFQSALRYLCAPRTLRDWLGLPAILVFIVSTALRHYGVDEHNRRFDNSPEQAEKRRRAQRSAEELFVV